MFAIFEIYPVLNLAIALVRQLMQHISLNLPGFSMCCTLATAGRSGSSSLAHDTAEMKAAQTGQA